MIPAYQITQLTLVEQRQRDAAREARHARGELPAAAPVPATTDARWLGAVRRAIATVTGPARRPSAA